MTTQLLTPPQNDDEIDRQEPIRPHRRRRRAVVAVLLSLAVLLGVPVGLVGYAAHRFSTQITRLNGVFDGLPDRPSKPSTGTAAAAVNILVMGTDRRSAVPTTGTTAQAPAWVYGAQRADAMMIVHIDGDRRGVTVISLPRDSWVDIPGHGMNKINAAYSWGGPSLAVETVEKLTDVHIDHVAVVDWSGFEVVADALGGVDVTVPETVHDSARGVTWTAGTHHLTGIEALDYVGERYGLPLGDLDRARRQQLFFRGLADTVLQSDVASHPTRLYHLIDVFTQHLSIDSGWSDTDMVGLAVSLRHLRATDIHYLTVPVTGTGMEGAQSVVHLDRRGDLSLWRAVHHDDVGAWASEHAEDVTGQIVR